MKPEHQPHTACIQKSISQTPTIYIEETNDKGDIKFKGEGNVVTIVAVENVGHISKLGTERTSGGDSGSGHWIYNDDGRAVLIGSTEMGSTGASFADWASMIQKTTDNTILTFIKHNLDYGP